ncbi:hypothetical protein B4923_00865 [Brenneria roseae subsp. americana]|uniref:Uncharacterized protein n=1 Tax=Brenneria roseae subsp. americana TaxID=1508507 RepID=A0A2U1U201_9GAMM|nr:hypothetical protein B4923_00865 [Brenneria roseae subsp. americana]PWC21763.1 hypothetical protein DDT52_05445 [Brenneria roseae subsp. roseae]
MRELLLHNLFHHFIPQIPTLKSVRRVLKPCQARAGVLWNYFYMILGCHEGKKNSGEELIKINVMKI